MSSLQTRTASALIMAPAFAAIVWFAGWPFTTFLCVAAAIALFEWFNLVQKLATAQAAIFFAGTSYILLSLYSFYLCRDLGGALIILLILMVWASDIGAYFFGKFIGGPKLLPQVSPNKTWAGFVGALLCPAVTLFLFALIYNDTSQEWGAYLFAFSLVFGGIVGSLGQAGDLLMSYFKRQAKVKDTGNLIPGHGGLLDRIDSLLLVTPIFYVLLKYFVLIVTQS